MKRISSLPPQTRTLECDFTRADKESRTVDLSFSSEEPVERIFGNEVLGHKPEEVRLDRLRNSAPLLFNHNLDDVVGVVEDASVRKGRGVATVRFSSGPRGEAVFNDVQEGILRNVSVGYRIHELTDNKDDEHVRVTDWTPYEISIVSVPADGSVGVGRGQSEEPNKVKWTSTMSDETKQTAPPEPKTRVEVVKEARDLTPEEMNKIRKEAGNQESTRIQGIYDVAKRFGHVTEEQAAQWIKDGNSLDEVRRLIIETLPNQSVKPTNGGSEQLGMSDKEKREYSIVKAIRELAAGKQLSGVEKEAHDALAQRIKRPAEGFLVPADVAGYDHTRCIRELIAQGRYDHRQLQAEVFASGGATVGTNILTGSMIELLRNREVTTQTGAQRLTGLVGDVAIPRVTGGATVAWLDETSAVTASTQTFGQVLLTPHRLSAATAYTKQLLAQSSISIEAFIRDDLARVLAIEKDRAAIHGTGGAGEPVGIVNTAGIGAFTITTGAPTWVEIVAAETDLGTANVTDMPVWVGNAAARGELKVTLKAASTAVYLLEGSTMNGYQYIQSQQVASNFLLFGAFNNLVIGDWDGFDVVVDPYSLSLNNQVRIVVNIMTDIGVRQPTAFTYSSNAVI